MLILALKQKHKNCKCSTMGLKFRKSPRASTENYLHKITLEHRKKGRKVSMNFERTTTRKMMKVWQPVQAGTFKVSA